jgi:glycosyltransferase involved in cell wall biosynthesis
MKRTTHLVLAEPKRTEQPPMEPTTRALHVVLVAHDVHDGGGMERACGELIRRSPGDIAFTVVSRTLADDLRDRVTWRRVPTPNRPFLLKYVTFFLLGAVQLMRTRSGLRHTVGAIVPNRTDVVAVHFCHAGYVTRTRHFAPPGATWIRRLNTGATRIVSRLAERWCYRPGRVRAFAAVSPGVALELEVHFPGIPIVITPNGVDVARFAALDGRERHPRQAGKAMVALFVGGDWDRKGLGPAIEGLAEARRRSNRRLELWVVGRGDERRFRRMAEQAGVAKCVRFFGFRGGLEQFYDAADVLVLPTLYEADSLVLHEAAAAGLAIVVTRVNGVEELLGDDEGGFVVDRDPRSIGTALARLAVDEPLRLRQAATARANARAMSWERSAAGVINLYRRLDARLPIGGGRP